MTDINRLLASLKRRSAHAKEFGHDILFVKIEDIDALVEVLEKAQQQNISDFEIKARLCKESNSLHDRLREAEKRIAELESRTVKLPAACADDEYFNDGVFQPMRYERDVERAIRAAGIKWEVE
ncbi:hypothetical protein [Klebsiella aerogenes]|uniref:hypothetical protein n=1 Tax=Klebsiella aerogenes TaxID=548 RepID=UPI0039790CE3